MRKEITVRHLFGMWQVRSPFGINWFDSYEEALAMAEAREEQWRVNLESIQCWLEKHGKNKEKKKEEERCTLD